MVAGCENLTHDTSAHSRDASHEGPSYDAGHRAADLKEAKLVVTTCITHSIQAEAVDAAAGTATNGKTRPTAKHGTAISQPATSPTHAPHLAAVSGAKRPAVDASTAVNTLAAQEGSETTDIMTASAGSSLSCEQLASSLQDAGVTYSTPSRAQPHCAPVEYQYVLGDITLTYGHSSFQGARDYQEDTVACVPLTSGLAGGVFDGHGGDDVSRELERVLLQNINRQITDVCARSPDDVRAMQAREAGSCAVTAFVTRVQGQPYLLCANAGDCRAVLFTQLPDGTRKAVRLSEDHKPQPHVCPSEITRINDAGGCVLWGRVQGCLAVSRAFGDRTLQPFVIPDPHVLGRPLDPKADLFFYLASDG
ncbi:PPM-type phosphatase domain-containing protein, partial [Haematococcus lacustris]